MAAASTARRAACRVRATPEGPSARGATDAEAVPSRAGKVRDKAKTKAKVKATAKPKTKGKTTAAVKRKATSKPKAARKTTANKKAAVATKTKVEVAAETESEIAAAAPKPEPEPKPVRRAATKPPARPRAKPNALVQRVYNTIDSELSKLEQQKGLTSQDRERASRALSQMVKALEKAVEMQRDITKSKPSGSDARNKEALAHAEDLRREIADRLERLNRKRPAPRRSE